MALRYAIGPSHYDRGRAALFFGSRLALEVTEKGGRMLPQAVFRLFSGGHRILKDSAAENSRTADYAANEEKR